MIERDDCTIVVCSCDNYEDTWFPFFFLLKKYWADCPYNIVLNTEHKQYSFTGLNITCINLDSEDKNIPYGERLIRCLKKINTRSVLILLDDFFIRSNVDTKRISYYVSEINDNNNIAVFSFESSPDAMNIASEKYEIFYLRPKCGEYKVNFQAAIWNRNVLLDLIRPHESPWEIEIRGSIRSFDSNLKFYTLKDIKDTCIDYGKKSGLTWGIVRGKWVIEDVAPLFKENNIKVDFEKRGIFERDNYTDISKSKFSIKRDILSYGLTLYVEMLVFRFFRIIKKVFGLPYDRDYVEYRRRKERNENLVIK